MPAVPLIPPVPPLPPPDGAVAPFRWLVVVFVKLPATPVPADDPPPPPKLVAVPIAPLPPFSTVVPTPALAKPPAPLVFELSATLAPPLASRVPVEPNHESLAVVVVLVVLPIPTLTVYVVPGTTVKTLEE